ncbi:MAG: sigma-70 family RNA polymerase sigma factor [Acidimicrobiales bacterium]|nr:sigma-70 family RNA polymerase sigma factor [Acidimicrobiales bacterium]
MLKQDQRAESFTDFVQQAGHRIQHALVAGFGTEVGVDAAAEALAYGWEHWDRIRSMGNPPGYVYSVGRDRARRMKRARVVVGATPVLFEAPWVEPRLGSALDNLSERQRLAVVLVHGAEWTISEVADLLEINRGSVKRHLERGMEKLRRSIGGER